LTKRESHSICFLGRLHYPISSSEVSPEIPGSIDWHSGGFVHLLVDPQMSSFQGMARQSNVHVGPMSPVL
jgi:hypothetical protein